MSLEMPYDKDLEELLIGNVLLNKRLTVEEKAVSVVDFYFPTNQRIWQVFCEMDEDSESIEISDVHRRVDLEHLKISSLANMTNGVLGETRAKDVKALKDISTLRSLIRSYANLARMAERKEPVADILTENSAILDQIQSEQDKRSGTSQLLSDVMEKEVFTRLDKFVSGEMVKVPFGFPSLDNSTNGGASLGELVVLGALPKSGKSVLLLQIARSLAHRILQGTQRNFTKIQSVGKLQPFNKMQLWVDCVHGLRLERGAAYRTQVLLLTPDGSIVRKFGSLGESYEYFQITKTYVEQFIGNYLQAEIFPAFACEYDTPAIHNRIRKMTEIRTHS